MPSHKPSILDADLESHLRRHPGTLEGLVPVWGSAREAIADAYDGDYLGAVGNGLLAVTDVVPAGTIFKVGAKAAKAASTTAKTSAGLRGVRKGANAALDAVIKRGSPSHRQMTNWYRKNGYREKGEAAHHVFVQKGSELGKQRPGLVNQSWNLMPLDAVTHGRLHGPYTVGGVTLPRYNLGERLAYGTPRHVKEWAATYAASRTARGLDDDG